MRDKSLLLKGGRLIDPRSGFHGETKDVLIVNGVIARIDSNIEAPDGVKTIELNGAYATPGFIDTHVHAFVYKGLFDARSLGLPADMIGVCQGVTTLIDAGTAGPATMGLFVDEVVKKSRTRVYSAMHYASDGLKNPPEADDPAKYDFDEGVAAYKKYAPYIVAIKARASNSCVGQLGITSIVAGKKLARAVGLPMLVHIGHMPPRIEEVADLLDKGDIITHAFHGKDNNLIDLANKKVTPSTQAARDRGVLFDIGHGKDSFNFNTGRIAKEIGFYPDSISTDLHTQSYHKPVQSLAETMSKFLVFGYSLEQIIDWVTGAPAAHLGLDKLGLGSLKVGAQGDVTVFTVRSGEYLFIDANKNELHGTEMITPIYAVVGGGIEMDADSEFRKLCAAADVSSNYVSEYEYMALTTLKYLDSRGVHIDVEHLPPFLNHLIALMNRLRAGEHVDAMDEEMLSQIDQQALEITDGALAPIVDRYGPADTAERILVAIHVQTSMGL